MAIVAFLEFLRYSFYLAVIFCSVAVLFLSLIYFKEILKSNVKFVFLLVFIIILQIPLHFFMQFLNETYRQSNADEMHKTESIKQNKDELHRRLWQKFSDENSNLIEKEKRGGLLKSKTFEILCDDDGKGGCKEKENWYDELISKNCEYLADTFSLYCKTWINEEYFVDVKEICKKVSQVKINKNSNSQEKLFYQMNKEKCQDFEKGKIILPNQLFTK